MSLVVQGRQLEVIQVPPQAARINQRTGEMQEAREGYCQVDIYDPRGNKANRLTVCKAKEDRYKLLIANNDSEVEYPVNAIAYKIGDRSAEISLTIIDDYFDESGK